jgi:cytochrome bd ubiquinol oxidase subunit I
MEYPLFEVPKLGGGLLVALVAIVHVVIAHFAVGAGLYLAITHTVALRRNDLLLLRYLRDHSQFLVLFSFVAGALTGVGIWVTIGLVSPAATSRLIHNFVWGWAIEWCFFAIEIAAGYVYYYYWDRMEPRKHLVVGWIYAIAAFFSLVVINGILTFMLTPSRWAEMVRDAAAGQAFNADLGFWLGFFNQTYWPSLILRTVSGLALAAIFVAVVVNARRSYTREERQRIINHGAWFMAPLILMVPVGFWYFTQLPEHSRLFVQGRAIAMTLFMAFGLVASLAIGFYAYFGLLRAKRNMDLETSLLLLAFAFVATGAMEFVREGVRKPYLIYGYLYSNGIPAMGEMPARIADDGILPHAPFARPPGQTLAEVRQLPATARGKLVFQAQCRMCHEVDGYNAMRHLVAGKSRELLTAQLKELEKWAYMPPFQGTHEEMSALAEYLLQLNPATSVAATGQEVSR